MKQKRAKAYRKQMAYYHLNFKFREPYQVLVDEEIILEAIKTKYDLIKGLERTLQGKIKPMITQCTMSHLYRTKNSEAIALGKSFERRRCGHFTKQDEELKSSYECMVECVDINGQNKHRYVVASQKPKLRARLRRLAAVPLVYINRAVMIMEPMSPMTEKIQDQLEKEKLTNGLNTVLKEKDEEEQNTISRKRKRTKEPNPLSVKKKKVEGKGEKSQLKRIGQEERGEEKKNGSEEDNGETNINDGSARKRKRRRRHNRERKEENVSDNGGIEFDSESAGFNDKKVDVEDDVETQS